MKFALENAADLAVRVWWACATNDDNKFAMGTIDTPYNSYYFAARANAFCKIAEWLISEMKIEDRAACVRAEEILEIISDWGLTPVRTCNTHIENETIQELLRPEF